VGALLNLALRVVTTLPRVLLNGWAAALLLTAAALVFLHYRRIAIMETELYGTPKHRPLAQTLHSLWLGAVGGALGSVLVSAAGVGLVHVPGAASALLYLWPVSLALGALNPRFVCFAYSGSLVAVLHLITGWPRVDVAALMALVAVLHMVEALLIRLSGAACPTPMTVAGRHDEAVPGFMLQRLWPVPLVLPLFTAAAGAPVDVPGWWPLLRPDPAVVGAAVPLGWQLLPVVVTMGYSDLAIAAPPAVRVRQSSRLLLLYSAVLLALALAGAHFRPLLWAVALFSAIGHEAMAVWSARAQLAGESCLKRPHRGVGVLDVLPGSPAAAAGLAPGAVILAVEDREVHTRTGLHEALLAAPAYMRLMYRNGREICNCRLPRPVEGLFGLGVILLPEPDDRALTRLRRPGFFRRSELEP
jgi:hypothetical protein